MVHATRSLPRALLRHNLFYAEEREISIQISIFDTTRTKHHSITQNLLTK